MAETAEKEVETAPKGRPPEHKPSKPYYVVLRTFTGARKHTPGELVEAHDWRNRGLLVEQNRIEKYEGKLPRAGKDGIRRVNLPAKRSEGRRKDDVDV